VEGRIILKLVFVNIVIRVC